MLAKCIKCHGTGRWRRGLGCLACHGTGRVPVPDALPVNENALVGAFNRAKRNEVKRISVRLGEYVIKPGLPHHKRPHALHVSHGDDYMGWIEQGMFVRSQLCNLERAQAIQALMIAPLMAAMQYGLTTGRCPFCGHRLSANSADQGIGVNCFDNYLS